MDLQALVDEITELVLQQLGGVARATAGGPQVLVVMGDGERGGEHLSSQIRAVAQAGGRVALVGSASWPRDRLLGAVASDAVRLLEAPATWSKLVLDCRTVVVPNLSLHELASLSLLLSPTPATGAVMSALIEGRPVLAGSDDIDLLTVNAARLPKPIVEGARAHAAKAAAMGVRLLEGQRLADEIVVQQAPTSAAPAAQRGRNVLTRDDVEVMLRGGARAIEVVAGTIVTPLAHEVARAAGVEIVVR